METQEKRADLLNTLIEINNDRIEGYGKAIEIISGTSDIDLQTIFEMYRDQSIQFKAELIPLVRRTGEEPTDDTRTSGKLFRVWMDIKSAVTPSSARAVLESCERGEDEFKAVYRKCLEDAGTDAVDLIPIIQSQAELQLTAHDHIKELRDHTD
ncbi:MAG TPA: PA2169 family four-helix-bundle protein [Sphingobacterium sp.]|nr:PA2169 family four-helix-bundle protein [Sphingobacterium sp.]